MITLVTCMQTLPKTTEAVCRQVRQARFKQTHKKKSTSQLANKPERLNKEIHKKVKIQL